MAGLGDFVEKRGDAWERLSYLTAKAQTRRGVRHLTTAELAELGPLYRRTASDLAYARLRGADPALLDTLNNLVLKAHGLLYGDRGGGVAQMRDFLLHEFPALVRKRGGYVFLAGMALVLGGVVGALIVATDPRGYSTLVGDRESEFYRDLPKTIKDGDRPADAAFLMTHNTRVGFTAFALGILGGLPTLLPLFMTGMMVGAIAVDQHRSGYSEIFWAFISPHAVPELMAIFIAAAAGMRIGHVLIAPGELRRRDALAVAGQEAVRMVLGTIPLFIIAGITESFVSPTGIPSVFKFAYGAMALFAMWLYLTPRRRRVA
jgi:uncharacterized membrane protein SpoIIM required for sporulation